MMSSINKDRYSFKILEWLFIIFAVGFYPMLTSMYPLLPPLVGIAGLVIIYNMERSIIYTLAAMIYLIHLDLNLSLPFLLSIFSVIFINMFIYSTAKLMIRCRVCLNIFLIFMIDGVYYMNLFLYDIVFDTKTIVADSILTYYILSDMIIGLIL